MSRRSFQNLYELISYYLVIVDKTEEEFAASVLLFAGDFEKIQNNKIGATLTNNVLNDMATFLSLDLETKSLMIYLSKKSFN